jgi:Mn-dependent DtxR family transcriptional regulator
VVVHEGSSLATAAQPKRDVSRLEDYLEAIYNLNEEKGFISTADISERLGVRPPTVSNMVAKLAKGGYLVHERYRGMKLTDQGMKVARSVIRRHAAIFEFLSMLGIGREIAYEDAEGIEHHLHPITIGKIERLVEYMRNNRKFLEEIEEGVNRS